MKREQVIELARKAGIETHERKGQIRFGIDVIGGDDSSEKFGRFAAMVEQATLERAAQRLSEIASKAEADNVLEQNHMQHTINGVATHAMRAAERAIRALSKEQQ